REREAHSMRDSAQVTAPGAVTSKIVAVSTSPNRRIGAHARTELVSLPSVPLMALGRIVRAESGKMYELLHTEPRLRVAPPCKVLVSQQVRLWAARSNQPSTT